MIPSSLLFFLLFWISSISSSPDSDPPFGPLDRFWRHHRTHRSLVVNGVNRFEDIQDCLDTLLTPTDRFNLQTHTGERNVLQLVDLGEPQPYAVVLQHAMTPLHVRAVQHLAQCVKHNLPELYEHRPMYQEFNLEEDPGLGGNCPVHLVALIAIFLPDVVAEIQAAVQTAYRAAGWEAVRRQHLAEEGMPAYQRMPPPRHLGVRASEHLTYTGFNRLADHVDGDATAFTVNFAFSGPDEYRGGEFYIKSKRTGEKTWLKPNKHDCIVFLGGTYLHGVEDIEGGHREMFSTELWGFPDLPFGSTLWTASPENMEQFIEECDEEQVDEEGNPDYSIPCASQFSTASQHGVKMDDIRAKYNNEVGGTRVKAEEKARLKTKKKTKKKKKKLIKPTATSNSRPRHPIVPDGLTPIRYQDSSGRVYDLESFRPLSEEPRFLIPQHLQPGEMVPIRWRDTFEPVDGPDGESFVIGFPPELLKEFQNYVAQSGMMEVAYQMLYQDDTPLQRGEQRVYTLEDGQKWSAMIQGEWETDMVWLDPADETCYESLLAMLGRGNFDTVLEQVGKAFDLDGLMIQGVGAIYLAESTGLDNMHKDIPGSKRSFYNIIVPVHVPPNDTARLNIGDVVRDDEGPTALTPNAGIVLGGESEHGTARCNYKAEEEFRLSFAIYVADINPENIDLIASDSTSLWPSEGDVEWFWAQRGRVWSREGGKSLKQDRGRRPMNVTEKSEKCEEWDVALCEDDPNGMRLLCPKKCKLYLEDDVYYKMLAESQQQKPQIRTD